MKIESHDISIEKLLQGNYFKIPRFQRPYSWEAEHISEFWSDVIANFEDTYFIGSMVVYHTGRNELAVVDGQQRLTTITIFLSAIRDAFVDLKEIELARGLQSYIERKNRDNQDVFVLTTETSFPYFQDTVLKFDASDMDHEVGKEEEAIERAFNIFSRNLADKISGFFNDKSLSDEDQLESAKNWLKGLRDTILDLNVILVELDNEDDAYLIFETLNTRGKDLALSDLVKNHFTKYLKAGGALDTSRLKWNRIMTVLGESTEDLDADTFIVHSWQSRYENVTKAKAFPKLRAQIKQKNAQTHLEAFLKDAGYWRSIFEMDYQWEADEREIVQSLRALRMFRVVQPTPGLLSLIRAYREKKIKRKKLAATLRSIENFHFSFTAVTSSRSSGGISGMYSSFGRKIFEATDTNVAAAEIRSLEAKLRERVPPISEFKATFEQILYTKDRTSQRNLVRYVLERISEHQKQPTVGNSQNLTIEHLIPQSQIKSGRREEVIGQLGNLILVDQQTNNLLGEKSFSDKKKILKDAGYTLPELFASADEITDELIQDNTRRLAELALEECWKI
ncbi:DUF262 domain-containing protein [Celeribacter sp. SCSIO 80788]|uniref:DUF262 domain-containing protein n=1 Tax=Celeribacter sp. SCSIO 80788 TaxID=3117013 RepID=UPI003DA1E9C3